MRRWLPRIFIAGLIAYSAFYLAPAIFRGWYFNSDEYVVIAEVIRFANLDFHQRFFDQPETPIMLLSAALWRIVYGAAWVTGFAGKTAGVGVFTFAHLPLLFEITRAVSFLPGLISIALMYRLGSTLTNPAGGCAAALLLAMNPDFASMESFIRPEPLAVCAFLAALLCLERALNPRPPVSEIRWILGAGLFAGLAAATRLHSITATVPVLLLILLSDRAPLPKYPLWMGRWWKGILAAAFAGVLLAIAGIKTRFLPHTTRGRMLAEVWPKSFDTLVTLCAMLALLLLVIWIFRPARVFHPRLLVLAAGITVAFFSGNPAILWRPQQFFESVQMYTTTYIDLERRSWPFARHAEWLFTFYIHHIAPDTIWLILMAAGAALILLRRDRRVLPLLIGAAAFFFARPLNMVPVPHHFLLWLPLFAIAAAYPVARAYELAGPTARPIALAVFLIAAIFFTTPGPKATYAGVANDRDRLDAIALATDWIHRNAGARATVAISYFCFNSDAFLTSMHEMKVPAPPTTDERTYILWWSGRATLKGLSGYACATPADVGYLKTDMDLRSPGEGANPFTDPEFQRLQSFHAGSQQADVFHFDFSNAPK